MNRLLFTLFLLNACGNAAPESAEPETDGSELSTEPEDLGPPSVCSNPPRSACGEPGSVVMGSVRLPPDHTGPTSGDLVIYLNHAFTFGNAEEGGFLHYGTRLPGVELADGPVEFTLDMCEGGAMWSEQNCGYVLIGILDQNGNNDFDLATFSANPVPDRGEPGFRVDLDLSCDDTEGHCLEIEMDCRGPRCARGEDLRPCTCEASSCQSIASGCI